MTLLQRFSLICLLVFCIFGYVLGFIITHSLERFMIDEAKETTAAFIEEEFRHEFKSTDFKSAKTGEEYNLFAERLRHVTFGKGVERIKVWAADGTVLWADNKEIVGRKFSDNKDLKAAVAGEIVSEISSLKKKENITERSHDRLIELYVPVTWDPEEGVGAVFEVYQNLRYLIQTIEQQKKLIWISVAIGFGFLYIALFGLVWGASKRLTFQNREIVRTQERYSNLIRAAHDGIISMDRSARIVLCNIAAQQIFGRTSGQLLGLSALELVREADHDLFHKAIDICIQCNTDKDCGVPFEVIGRKLDGGSIPIELSLTSSGVHEDLLVTGFIRDISVRKAMQEQILTSEKMATVSVIAGSIGHEIKNVLSSLLGYSELLMMRENNDELTARCAEVFSSQTQRLNLHANNLLNLGKPQKPEMKNIALHGFLDRVTELLSASGFFKLCTVIKRYSDNELVVVGDEMLLEQVVRNLQINALHAMEKQGILTLSTRVSADNTYAEISVSDTGHGIKDNIRHQIFLPFFSTKEKGKGTGLGLYIVKQIIEQHKGYIKIDSQEGVGTIVVIGIPLLTPL